MGLVKRPAAFTSEQEALAEAVRGYCRARCTDAVRRAPADSFPADFWTGLADVGVFALAAPDEEGGGGEIIAASTELGRAAVPGPVAATCFAAHVLAAGQARSLVDGTALVSVGVPSLMPWAPIADVFIEWTGDEAGLLRRVGDVEPVETLGGEPWGRVRTERVGALDRVAAAGDLFHLAVAGYGIGAGRRVLDTAIEYARTREQFGRRIGSFQAVAHPLVNASLELEAAEKLSIVAGHAVDTKHEDARSVVAAARLSASRAAMNAAFAAHQTLGAVGYSVEGPIGLVTQRIRQSTLVTDAESELAQRVLSTFSAER